MKTFQVHLPGCHGDVNMSKRIKCNQNFLKYLCVCGKNQRKALIKSATPEELNSLCECILNVYKKNVPVSKGVTKKLLPFKKVVSKLATKKRLSANKKKQMLVQSGEGAFIPILLASVLPHILGSVFGS